MSTLDDAMEVESGGESEESFRQAMQALIDNGQCWLFQCSFGRSAMDAIESGLCILGPTQHTDYYGNKVPSRDDVVSGTVGSLEYAKQLRPDLWEITTC